MKKILWTTYVLFFIFIIYYGMVASRTFDGDVRHSYEKGMAYPAKVARLEELGWELKGSTENLVVGQPSNFVLSITDKEDKPVRGADVSITVSRPATPEGMPTVKATERERGDYMAQITLPSYGHWLVSVKIQLQEDEFEYDYKVYANKGGVNANG